MFDCHSPNHNSSTQHRGGQTSRQQNIRWSQTGSVDSPVLGNLTSSSIVNKKRSKESEKTGTDNHEKTPLRSFEMPAKNAEVSDSDRLDNIAFEVKSPTKQNDDDEDAIMQSLEASSEQMAMQSPSKSSKVPELIKLPQKRSKRSDGDYLSSHLRDQVVAPVRNEMGDIIMDQSATSQQ